MEIVESNAGLLSNYEMYMLMLEIRETQKNQKRSSRPHALATLVYETLKYFEQCSPCVDYKYEQLETLLKSVKPFKLTKAEFMQILNLRPANAVEIQLIVEECEERLTEQQVDELLQLIATILPAKNKTSAPRFASNENLASTSSLVDNEEIL